MVWSIKHNSAIQIMNGTYGSGNDPRCNYEGQDVNVTTVDFTNVRHLSCITLTKILASAFSNVFTL
jgi:hypothetical protein